MGLCWVNEGAGHSRLQEQEKQRDRVMRPQRPGETQSLSEVGEVRRSQKGERRAGDKRGLVHCPKAIVPGSVMVNASQKSHLGSSGEGGSSA